jgi:mono/diheme cytochrome c family protein
MKKHWFTFLVFAGIVLSSCTTTEIPLDEITEPVAEVVTYTGNVKAIIDNNCTSCHGAVSPQAGLSLVTYQQVRNAAENGNLIPRMNNPTAPMPPSGRLSANIRAIIDSWADDGFPEE